MRPLFLTAVALALVACTPPTPPLANATPSATNQPPVMAWPALLSRPRPAPTRTIPYGTDPLQVAELWLPADLIVLETRASAAAVDAITPGEQKSFPT